MDADQIQAIVIAILTGGAIAGVGTVIKSRREAKKIGVEAKAIEDKLPAELESLIVTNAEGTVVMMHAVNEHLVAELARRDAEYKAEIERRDALDVKKDAHIANLEAQLNDLRHALSEANTLSHNLLVQLDTVHQQYARLEAEMQNYRNDTP